SRRRHTRFSRDWSSDVCSSDLYIGLTDTPTNMFGKLMSISDELMKKYYLLLCRRPASEVDAIIKGIDDGSLHPMTAKKDLAQERSEERRVGKECKARWTLYE